MSHVGLPQYCFSKDPDNAGCGMLYSRKVVSGLCGRCQLRGMLEDAKGVMVGSTCPLVLVPSVTKV